MEGVEALEVDRCRFRELKKLCLPIQEVVVPERIELEGPEIKIISREWQVERHKVNLEIKHKRAFEKADAEGT